MEKPETSDKKIEIIIRCIHPNLNWAAQQGSDYSKAYIAMTTLVEDYHAKVKSSILCRSQFFKDIIEKDSLILAKGKAIEIKITARKHQVSIESLFSCLDYLDHFNFIEIEINRKNMLSLLVTSNFLKISSLENYCAEYISNHITSSYIVDIAIISNQIKKIKLLNKAYMWDIF